MELRFSYYFCLINEGSGAGSVPRTTGSGSGRPKNIRILRIRISNSYFPFLMNFIMNRTRGSGIARATCWCTPGCAAGGRAAPCSSPPPPSCGRTTTASSSASSPTLPPPSTGSYSSTSPVPICIHHLPYSVQPFIFLSNFANLSGTYEYIYSSPALFCTVIQYPLQCCGSEFFHPGSASKNLSILTQNIVSKLSENDPGCSSRIRIFTYPGSRGQQGTGSWILIRNTGPPYSAKPLIFRSNFVNGLTDNNFKFLNLIWIFRFSHNCPVFILKRSFEFKNSSCLMEWFGNIRNPDSNSTNP